MRRCLQGRYKASAEGMALCGSLPTYARDSRPTASRRLWLPTPCCSAPVCRFVSFYEGVELEHAAGAASRCLLSSAGACDATTGGRTVGLLDWTVFALASPREGCLRHSTIADGNELVEGTFKLSFDTRNCPDCCATQDANGEVIHDGGASGDVMSDVAPIVCTASTFSETGPIDYRASASEVQAALEGLENIDHVQVSETRNGHFGGKQWHVTFSGEGVAADVPLLVADDSSMGDHLGLVGSPGAFVAASEIVKGRAIYGSTCRCEPVLRVDGGRSDQSRVAIPLCLAPFALTDG